MGNGAVRPRQCGKYMCDKCKPIDDRIAHYRRLRTGINDRQTVDGIARLIADLELQKLALHPEQREPNGPVNAHEQ